MKLARIQHEDFVVPVLIDGEGNLYDLSEHTPDIDGAFLASDRFAAAEHSYREHQLPELESSGRYLAPIASPSVVVCIGMNYAAHAAESGSQPPSLPIVFFKPPNTVVGPEVDVLIPPASSKTDWEVELGLVIGKRASYLSSEAEALGHIAGFVLVNDVSERHWQIDISGGQWSKGKSFPTFTPVGPWLVTPDEIDHHKLTLSSWVNGESRQHSSTADMIFGVERIVWELSQFMTLEPGDLILTGTPEGVALSGRFPYLHPGDVYEGTIDGLGRQRQRFVATSDPSSG